MAAVSLALLSKPCASCAPLADFSICAWQPRQRARQTAQRTSPPPVWLLPPPPPGSPRAATARHPLFPAPRPQPVPQNLLDRPEWVGKMLARIAGMTCDFLEAVTDQQVVGVDAAGKTVVKTAVMPRTAVVHAQVGRRAARGRLGRRGRGAGLH